MADDTIAVKPARKGMSLSHPIAGALHDDGGDWPSDQFTFRRIADGDVKRLTDEQIKARAEKREADDKAAHEAAEKAAEEAKAKAKADAEAQRAAGAEAAELVKAPAPAPDLSAIKETVTATAQAAEPSKPARR